MARPPKPEGDRRSETVHARGTKVERERWEEVAWRRRTTISEMVRDFLNKEAAKELGPIVAPELPAPKLAKKAPRKKAGA